MAVLLEPFETIECLNHEPLHDLVKIEATFGSAKGVSRHAMEAVAFSVHQTLLREVLESVFNFRIVGNGRPTLQQDLSPADLPGFGEGLPLSLLVIDVNADISEGLPLQIGIESMTHQVFIVLHLGLSFIPIGSKLVESSLEVVLLLDFSIILFVLPVILEVGEYSPLQLALLNFVKFVSINSFVESSVPFPHMVNFHKLEMS